MDTVKVFPTMAREALEKVQFCRDIFENCQSQEGEDGKIHELGFLERGKMAQDLVRVGVTSRDIFGLFRAVQVLRSSVAFMACVEQSSDNFC
jgi:hypothetical protein